MPWLQLSGEGTRVMGSLRCLLAILVVCTHVQPLTGGPTEYARGGAVFAVKAFFIISGFYMSLVLDRQYRERTVTDFYVSRLARLLPLYWLVGLCTVACEYFFVPPGHMFYPLASPFAYGAGLQITKLPLLVVIYAAVAVLTMFGLDTGQWLGFGKLDGALSIFPHYGPQATSVMALSPVPPGWSIGIELCFYLIAPFIVRRPWWLIAVLGVASLAFRFGLARLDFTGDPWDRTLFPSELIYFLIGVGSYRLYLMVPKLKVPFVWFLRLSPIAMALIITPIYGFDANNWFLNSLPYAVVALGIPFLFDWTNSSEADARIGDLSYPIYIGHMFALGAAQLMLPAAFTKMLGTSWIWLSINVLVAISFAFLLDWLVARPIDNWRRRFGARPHDERVAVNALFTANVRAGMEVKLLSRQ